MINYTNINEINMGASPDTFLATADCNIGYTGQANASTCAVEPNTNTPSEYFLTGCQIFDCLTPSAANTPNYTNIVEIEMDSRHGVFAATADCNVGYMGVANVSTCAVGANINVASD